MQDDSDVTRVMQYAKELRLTVHVRGTDERPVIELRDKLTRAIVGGIELRRRMESINAS